MVMKISVLGSTGSIGKNTLDICRQHPERFDVIALAANRDIDTLYRQCLEFAPRFAVLADFAAAGKLAAQLAAVKPEIEVLAGEAGLVEIAELADVDMVMAAIVGAAGLLPALAAVRAGKKLLLANKEALVMSGQLFIEEARRHQATILPIDSEHNAIFQCLPENFHTHDNGLAAVGVSQILLTASGGPFLNTPLAQLATVTPEQAVAHPNWDMGRKISVDSATMMNKGLEVIEAHWLFDAPAEKIQVVLHPQSVIHSLVRYNDGSVLAQMGNPDMRTPIAHAMGWPQRIAAGVQPLDLFEVAELHFVRPDMERFPCLQLAYDAMQAGGSAPAILNAANEMAVTAFLERKIGFMDIPRINQQVLQAESAPAAESIEHLLEIDAKARQKAMEFIEQQVD